MATKTTKQTPAQQTPAPEVNGAGGNKKTECPVSRSQFLRAAKPLAIMMDGQLKSADVKEFTTGSFGWFLNEKVTVLIDGVPCKVQVGLNMTLIGSKEAKA